MEQVVTRKELRGSSSLSLASLRHIHATGMKQGQPSDIKLGFGYQASRW
jgi:hypothetical protein